ncbi:glycosyltransferase family 2 protein [Parvularcula lutaonensis]|uniref:Glycosyltransferase family 2 protein n=1 Tax=Parvularcula lutaonensis TaxID=491923 RepID=A0ABV7MCQ7_9PROT|nr:glycosyltransferase [Parvularcula lutaonensis]GGY40605.1 glycosyl transferase [Parvularcula lutaonensis]
MQIVMLLAVVASVFSAGLLLLGLWLLVEVLASGKVGGPVAKGGAGPMAVVIPAHNEEAGIAATLEDVKRQLRPRDRLIVVADNCSDRTADVALAAGAEMLARKDAEKRGKGYALQFALDHLRQNPPATVVFTDADCFHAEGLFEAVASVAETSGRPAQALYLMEAAESASPARKIAAFAWRLINKTRMEGLWRLAKTTRLTGAGAAFPWPVAEKLALGSGEIVEDLALTLTLAQQGMRIDFLPDVAVTSTFPESDSAATVQRARWEHGSLRMARARVPGLLVSGLTAPWKAMLALNVAVPPLTVFAAAVLAAGGVGAVLLMLGAWLPLLLAGLAALTFFDAVVIAYIRDGRSVLPPAELSRLPVFLLSKFGVYGKSGRASTKRWTRTPRS